MTKEEFRISEINSNILWFEENQKELLKEEHKNKWILIDNKNIVFVGSESGLHDFIKSKLNGSNGYVYFYNIEEEICNPVSSDGNVGIIKNTNIYDNIQTENNPTKTP